MSFRACETVIHDIVLLLDVGLCDVGVSVLLFRV